MPRVASRFTRGSCLCRCAAIFRPKATTTWEFPKITLGNCFGFLLWCCVSRDVNYMICIAEIVLSRYISFYNIVYVSCINFRCYARSLFEDKSQRCSRGNRSVCPRKWTLCDAWSCVGVTKKKRKPYLTKELVPSSVLFRISVHVRTIWVCCSYIYIGIYWTNIYTSCAHTWQS